MKLMFLFQKSVKGGQALGWGGKEASFGLLERQPAKGEKWSDTGREREEPPIKKTKRLKGEFCGPKSHHRPSRRRVVVVDII